MSPRSPPGPQGGHLLLRPLYDNELDCTGGAGNVVEVAGVGGLQEPGDRDVPFRGLTTSGKCGDKIRLRRAVSLTKCVEQHDPTRKLPVASDFVGVWHSMIEFGTYRFLV